MQPPRVLIGLAAMTLLACSSSAKQNPDGAKPSSEVASGTETARADVHEAALSPNDGGDAAGGDVAMDKPALDITMDVNRSGDERDTSLPTDAYDVSRSGEDVKDTVSPVDAECYPGLAASCTVALPIYDPCGDPACQGYSRFCTNGKWTWVHCDPIVEPPRPDAAAERAPVDTTLDSRAVDAASLDGPPSGG